VGAGRADQQTRYISLALAHKIYLVNSERWRLNTAPDGRPKPTKGSVRSRAAPRQRVLAREHVRPARFPGAIKADSPSLIMWRSWRRAQVPPAGARPRTRRRALAVRTDPAHSWQVEVTSLDSGSERRPLLRSEGQPRPVRVLWNRAPRRRRAGSALLPRTHRRCRRCDGYVALLP
jgi:hypothetical protein